MKKFFFTLLFIWSTSIYAQINQFSTEWVFYNEDISADTLYNLKSQVLDGDSVLSLNVYRTSLNNFYNMSFNLIDSSGIEKWSINSYWQSPGCIMDFKVHNDTIYTLTYYTNQNNHNYKDIFIRKYDLSGNFLNMFSIPGDYNFWPFVGSQGLNHARQRNLIDIAPNGYIYIAAFIFEGTNIGSATQSVPLNFSATNEGEIVLIKTNLTGDIINIKKMGNEIGTEGINSISVIQDKLVLSAWFLTQQPIFPLAQNNPTGQFGIIMDNQFNLLEVIDSVQYIIPGQNSFYTRLGNKIKKWDLSANLIWTRQFNGISDFSVNQSGDYMVSGIFSNNVDVTTSNTGDEFTNNSSSFSIFLCRYNDQGVLENIGLLSTFWDISLPPSGVSIKTTPISFNNWYCFAHSSWDFEDINPLTLVSTPPASGISGTYITLKLNEISCNPTTINYGLINGCDDVTINGIQYNSSGNYTQSFGCDSTVVFELVLTNSFIQELCLVTVDSTSNYIKLIWEKPNDISGISAYNVYRETSLNNFTLIGNRSIDSLSIFIDNTVNPNSASYRYKITTINPCGVESNLASVGYHSSIHLQFLGNGNFQWSNYSPQIIESYDILRDDIGNGNYQLLNTLSSSSNTYTDVNYTNYPLANYRVVGNLLAGYQCSPNKSSNTVLSNIRNISQNYIDEISTEFISVYPNPTSADFTIEITKGLIGEDYTITDFSGRLLRSGKFHSNKEKVELDMFSNGVYLIQIKNRNIQQRIIKQ